MQRAMTLFVAVLVLSLLLVASPVAGSSDGGNAFVTLSANCRHNVTMPGLTWCSNSNPYILSNFLSRNSTDLTSRRPGSGGSEGESSFRIQMRCEYAAPGAPHRSCRAIQQIRSATIGFVRDDGTNGPNMTRFVIFTDLDGQMLFVYFNNNTMANNYDVGIQRVTAFDVGTVRAVDAASGRPFQSVVLLVANGTALGLKALYGNNSTFTRTCYLFTNIENNTMTLEYAEIFPKSSNFTELVNLGWVWKQSFLVNASNGTLIEAIGYGVYAAPARQSDVIDYIEACPPGTPMGIELGMFLYTTSEAKFRIYHSTVTNLTFLIAFSSRAVMMYTLKYDGPYDEKLANETGQIVYDSIVWVMFEWCRNTTIYNASSGQWETLPRQRTTIYCVPDEGTVITEVSMFTPETDSEIGVWSRVLWIVVGMQNATTTFMHTFALQELGSVTYEQSTMLNPLNLPPEFGTPAFPCDFETETYFAGYGCTRRFTIDHVFDDGDGSGANGTNPITQILIRIVEATNRSKTGQLPGAATDAASGDLAIPFVQATHGVAFVARGRRVSVITIFRGDIDEHGNGSPVAASLANEIDFLGDVTYLHASENAQHLFTAVAREEWEIESQQRYLDVCTKLAATPADPFLQAFAPTCAALPPQPVNLNTFAQYTSYCSFNVYCPSLDDVVFGLPRDSYYADRPAVLRLCPRGSFCAFGMMTQCPPGFYCDEEGLSQPKRCPTSPGFNTTCASYGLTAPQPCDEGAVCIVPHIPGLPAPYGRMVPAPPAARTTFVECAEGMWCNLGAQQAFNGSSVSNTTFLCPANTFCVNSSVMTPIACECSADGNISNGRGGIDQCDGRMLYCPAATTAVNWCPAGHSCTRPDRIDACFATQYCPPGTFAPALCPAGKYCPSPAVALECPSGSYCPKGSVSPVKCNFLTVCPAGSQSEARSFLAPFVLILVVAGVLAAFYLYARYQRRSKVAVEEAQPVSRGSRAFIERGGDGDESDDDAAATGNAAATEESLHSMAAVPLNANPMNIPTSLFKTPTITFRNMSLTLRVGEAKGKRVLDDVSGTIPPGSFVAVMGPSGSGKSTFMHTLAGKAFYGERSGHVLVNGDEVELTAFSKTIGFVKQDDIMIREMTVAETMLLNARVRYDKRSIDTPEQITNAMLRALDLNHVRDTNIGDEKKRGISGGQRKRVNIGMEMVALPSVLFLDEPTSGLDATSSMTVCSALRNMAEHGGVTVIAVIHQPRYEIFQMFHRVLLLAKGGKLVYYGEPQHALGYFESTLGVRCPEHANPPDFFMDVIAGDGVATTPSPQAASEPAAPRHQMTIDEMQEAWNKSELAARATVDDAAVKYEPTGRELAAAAAGKGMAGFLMQTYLFTERSLVQLSRDLAWFFTDLALVLVAGFFLGLVFSKSQYQPPLPGQIVNKSLENFGTTPPSSLREFFDRPIDDPVISEASLTCMAIGMTGVTAALRVFGNEQIVYWREASAGMSTPAYFLAKNISHVLFILLSPLLYLAPFLTFVSARASLIDYYKVLVVVQFSTTGLGYLVSMVVPGGLAQLAGVVAVLVFSMFGGSRPTLPQIDQMFPLLRVMPYISYVRWGQEALYIVEIAEWNKVTGVDIGPSLRLFGYSLDNFDQCMGICFAFGIIFRLLALFFMLVLNREQKH